MSKIKMKKMLKFTLASALALGVLTSNVELTEASEQSVERIQGDNRFETASLISSKSYTSSNTVIITDAREFADALAGVPLAYQKQAPILLAQGNKLRQNTIDEINRLGAKEAIILGGESAVSVEIERNLEELGLNTRRLAGDTRFETAEKIADELVSKKASNQAVVVDGFEFADALSIAPFAAQEGMPIYLTRTNTLSSEDLDRYETTYIIGGEHAVSTAVEKELNNVTRLAGDNRYETNVEVLSYFGVDSDELFIATGLDFVDALTGSVLAANNATGVGLVKNDVHPDLLAFFDTHFFTQFTILGGESAVPGIVQNTLTRYNDSKEVTEEIIKEKEVPFETVERENSDLLIGETEISQEGQNGYDKVTYKVSYTNGKETKRVELNREVVEPVEEIIEIGTKVIEMKSLTIGKSELTLFEMQEVQLNAEIAPVDTTYKALSWHSSNKEIATVADDGLVQAHKEGTVEITVSNNDNTVSDSITITVKKPIIIDYQELIYNITEFDSFRFPEVVSVQLSNDLTVDVNVKWEQEEISEYEVGEYTFTGLVEEYNFEIELTLTVNEYTPAVRTNSYSPVTINGVSTQLSLSILNYDVYRVNISKIEVYESGNLKTTHTPSSLESSNIPISINPSETWGISSRYPFGIYIDSNSYVKYYLTMNGKDFVIEESLQRNF